MNPQDFSTEWGVAWSLPESHGTSSADSRAQAEKIVRNMKTAGHQARVVWRSISAWQES